MSTKNIIQNGTAGASGWLASTTTFSFTHTCEDKPARVVIVSVDARHTSAAANTAVSTITYGGVTMTPVANAVNGGGAANAVRTSVFIIVNPTAGANTVAVTMAGSCTNVNAVACTFWEVDQNTSQDGTANSDAGQSTGTQAPVYSYTNERVAVVACVTVNNGGGIGIVRPNPTENPGSTPTTLYDVDQGAVETMMIIGTTDTFDGFLVDAFSFAGSFRYGHISTYLRPIRHRAHTT